MTITIPQQWTGVAGENDMEVKTAPTPGNWLIAVVSWRTSDGSQPSITVGDLPRNIWELIGTSDSVDGARHMQVWLARHIDYSGWELLCAYVAACQIVADDVGSVTCNVFEAAGMSDWLTVDSVTVGTATSATTFSIVMPAPSGGSNCLMVAGAAIDASAPTVTVTSAGWTALTQVQRTGSGPNMKMAPAWRTSTATQTPAWSSSVAANWVGIAVAVRETGTAVSQPNANYPYAVTEIGLGYDMSTPLQAASFTSVATMHRSLRGGRGLQAELGDAQTQQTAMVFDDPLGSLDGRPAATATATASGTTATIKVPDAQATGILYKGDFFRLWASGVLKQTQVFQITGTSSAAGTTTVTFSPAAAVSTATGDVLITTPLDLNTPWRERALWGGKWWPVAAGWTGDFTQVFSQGEGLTQVQMNGVDALKLLAVDSPTALRGEILRRSPTHYWPLDDPSGGGVAQNLGGYSTAQLVQVTSKFGAGSGSADFGASTQNVTAGGGSGLQSILGDNSTGWQQQALVSADVPTKGFALVGTDSLFPAIAGGVTIFGILMVPTADQSVYLGATADPTLMIVRNADPGDGAGLGSIIKVSINHATNQYRVTVWDQTTHAQTVTNASIGPSNSFQTWALTFDRTSWALYAGGVQQATGSANLAAAFTRIDFGGEADQFFNGQCFNGIHAHLAVFPRKLSATEISHIEVINEIGAIGSETVQSRMMRKLNTAGWRGARVIATSGLQVSAEPTDTDTLFGKLSKTAGYEDGIVFADALGQVQFRSRLASYHQVSRATLGENTAGGEIPFLRDVQRNVSPLFLYNIIRIANSLIGITGNAFSLQSSTAVAANSASAAKYSPGSGKAFDRATRLANQADAFGLACWLLARYATPMRRISSLTIDAAALAATIPNTVWPFVLGVEVGDLVVVNRRPVGAPPSSQLYRVLNIQHDRAAGRWLTTLTLGIAPATSLVLGDPVKGLLGSNAMAA